MKWLLIITTYSCDMLHGGCSNTAYNYIKSFETETTCKEVGEQLVAGSKRTQLPYSQYATGNQYQCVEERQ